MSYTKKHKLIAIIGIAVLIAIIMITIIFLRKIPTPHSPAVAKTVKFAVVTSAKIPESHTLSGSVQATDEAKLAAQVPGTVTALNVVLGSHVRAGELIAELDNQLINNQLNAANHNSAQASQAVRVANEQLKLAKITLDRNAALYKEGAISPYDYDKTQNNYSVAQESYQLAIAAAQAALSNAAAVSSNASYYRLTAPIDGIIAIKSVNVGDMVMPGQQLFTIEGNGAKVVDVYVPEELFKTVKIGMPIDVRSTDISVGSVQAVVIEIAPYITESSHDFKIRMQLPENFNRPVGSYVNVTINGTTTRTALLVPVSAVVERGQLTGVFVENNGVANFCIIRCGDNVFNGQYEVLSGLQQSDKVIISDTAVLFDGEKVQL